MDSYPPIDQLKTKISSDIILFFTDAASALNNWSPHAIDIWDKRFPTIEHAFHFQKLASTNPTAADDILAARSPYEAMRIARKYKADRRTDWDEVKITVMTELNRAKFDQNQDAREILLATGDRQLMENSPWDNFWGIGPKGDGRNEAGRILMNIRDELRASVSV